MPVKKAKKPSRSIRYLLSADRKLRKISLRKMSEGTKKTKPAARSRHSSKAVLPRQPLVPSLAISPRAIVLGLTGVLVAAALLAARQPLSRFNSASDEIGASQSTMDSPREPLPAPTRASLLPVPELTRATPVKEPAKPSPSNTPSAAPVTNRAANMSRPEKKPEIRAEVTTESRNPSRDAEAKPEPRPETTPETKTDASSDHTALTTVTGCLVTDGEGFRLKDASGADVPKARSWKSGFLRKKSVGIAIMDPAHTLHLTSYVGQRVATTGTLVDREMRARSLTRIASSCD